MGLPLVGTVVGIETLHLVSSFNNYLFCVGIRQLIWMFQMIFSLVLQFLASIRC